MLRRFPSVFLLCVLCGLTLYTQLGPAFDYRKKRKKIRKVVKLGTDVGDAGRWGSLKVAAPTTYPLTPGDAAP